MHRYVMLLVLAWLTGAVAASESSEEAGERVPANGRTALMAAAKAGDDDRVRTLVEQGADVNQPNNNGGTAIMYAALSGETETVSLLLGYDARVDAVAGNGWTALMIAAVKGHVEVARLLLDHGANPNVPDVYSWTPLMRAVYEQRTEMVRLLVENRQTDVNRRGENGVTALHLAVAKDDPEAARLLLGHGADPAVTDDLGRSPVDFARENNNLKLIGMMSAAGGQ